VARRGAVAWYVGWFAAIACLAFSFLGASQASAADYTTPTTPFTNPTHGITNPAFEGVYAGNERCIATSGGLADAEHRNISLLTICKLLRTGFVNESLRQFWQTMETIKVREKIEAETSKIESGNAKLSLIDEGVGDVYARLLSTEKLIETQNTKLGELVTGIKNLPKEIAKQTVSEPLSVSQSNPSAVSTPVAASIDASGEAIKGALWYLIGIAVLGLAGYLIYRQVMPRA
jgi:hypothetical protein